MTLAVEMGSTGLDVFIPSWEQSVKSLELLLKEAQDKVTDVEQQGFVGGDEVGVDQIIFLQQAGKNRHDHICESLELFGKEVLPEFVPKRKEREERKAEELAPYIEKALGRKRRMPELSDDEIPIVKASRERESFYRKD